MFTDLRLKRKKQVDYFGESYSIASSLSEIS